MNATWRLETGNGTSPLWVEHRNAGGIKCGSDAYCSYASIESGWQSLEELLAVYVDTFGYDLAAIREVYCYQCGDSDLNAFTQIFYEELEKEQKTMEIKANERKSAVLNQVNKSIQEYEVMTYLFEDMLERYEYYRIKFSDLGAELPSKMELHALNDVYERLSAYLIDVYGADLLEYMENEKLKPYMVDIDVQRTLTKKEFGVAFDFHDVVVSKIFNVLADVVELKTKTKGAVNNG